MQNGERTDTIAGDTVERLRRLEGRIPPAELSEIWVFPPLDDVEKSDEFHLFTRRVGDGVYRVCAAEFAGTGEPRVTVYGAVPESRVARIVAGFRQRLGERRDPLHLPIFGSEERWRLAVGAALEAETKVAAEPDTAAAALQPEEAVMEKAAMEEALAV